MKPKDMKTGRYFNQEELVRVGAAVSLSEELVNNHFKLSSGHWLKNRYDIKTAKDLMPQEKVAGPFAQVLKYEGRRTDAALGSSSYSLYAVCLQDPAILSVVENQEDICLDPFLVYVLVHELVHVVRFLRFEHRYENASEASVTLAEEQKVHGATYTILSAVSMQGLIQVFDFFKRWRVVHGQ